MFQRLLKRISRELKKASIPYMIIGGQAVLIYGEPRLTRDIDVALGIELDELPRVKSVIAAIGVKALVKDEEKFARRTMVIPTMEGKSGIRVDFIFSFRPTSKSGSESLIVH